MSYVISWVPKKICQKFQELLPNEAVSLSFQRTLSVPAATRRTRAASSCFSKAFITRSGSKLSKTCMNFLYGTNQNPMSLTLFPKLWRKERSNATLRDFRFCIFQENRYFILWMHTLVMGFSLHKGWASVLSHLTFTRNTIHRKRGGSLSLT